MSGDCGAFYFCCFTCLLGSSPPAVSLWRPIASWQTTCTVCKARICKAAQVQTEGAILWRYSSVFHQVSSRTNTIPKTIPKQQNSLNHLYECFLMRRHKACLLQHSPKDLPQPPFQKNCFNYYYLKKKKKKELAVP